jgi:hypothetical protein
MGGVQRELEEGVLRKEGSSTRQGKEVHGRREGIGHNFFYLG